MMSAQQVVNKQTRPDWLRRGRQGCRFFRAPAGTTRVHLEFF